jgi:ribosomal protein S4E
MYKPEYIKMKAMPPGKLTEGDRCRVTMGTHAGKTGTVRDMHTSKTGHITITVEQKNGLRFNTLGRNVVVERGDKE